MSKSFGSRTTKLVELELLTNPLRVFTVFLSKRDPGGAVPTAWAAGLMCGCYEECVTPAHFTLPQGGTHQDPGGLCGIDLRKCYTFTTSLNTMVCQQVISPFHNSWIVPYFRGKFSRIDYVNTSIFPSIFTFGKTAWTKLPKDINI